MPSKRTSQPSTGFFEKTVIAQVLLVAVFLGGLWLFDRSLSLSDRSALSSNVATLVLRMNEGERVFEGGVVEDMTILDALQAAVTAGNLEMQYRISSENDVEIVKLGEYAPGEAQFGFSLNGQAVAVKDLNRQLVKQGDIVELRIQ